MFFLRQWCNQCMLRRSQINTVLQKCSLSLCTHQLTASAPSHYSHQKQRIKLCHRTCRLSVPWRLILWGLLVLFGILLAFFAVSFGLLDFGVGAAACPLVVPPPGVQGRRSPIHGPLHVAKVGLAVLARPIAPPPVLPVHVNLIMETVIDLKMGGEGEVRL